MRVTIHQPVTNANVGDTITVSQTEGEWLVAHGYASAAKDDSDKTTATDAGEKPSAKSTTKRRKS